VRAESFTWFVCEEWGAGRYCKNHPSIYTLAATESLAGTAEVRSWD